MWVMEKGIFILALFSAIFTLNALAFTPEYYEKWGDSGQFAGWLDSEDSQLVGDFAGLGHDQVLFINRNGGVSQGRLMIVDFSEGMYQATVMYLPSYNETEEFYGWLDSQDSQRVGDFAGLGHDQVLFINRNGQIGSGKLMVVDFQPLAIANMPEIADRLASLDEINISQPADGFGAIEVSLASNESLNQSFSSDGVEEESMLLNKLSPIESLEYGDKQPLLFEKALANPIYRDELPSFSIKESKINFAAGSFSENPSNLAPPIFCSAPFYSTKSASSWFKEGNTYYKQGKYQEALDCYNNALSQNSQIKEVWYNKGKALIALAIGSFDGALLVDPKYSNATYAKKRHSPP